MAASLRLLFILLALIIWSVWVRPEPANTQAPAQAIEQNYLNVPPVVLPSRMLVSESPELPELMRVELTYFTCSEEEGTADCLTASGAPAGPGTIAHKSLPFGTVLIIAGERYTVSDRGGGLREGDVDVWVESRAKAFQLGRGEAIAEIERKDRK